MEKVRVLSFGAGVQSTVMALMAAKGEFGERPDFMIFADTGWEPEGVYTHLKWTDAEIARLTNAQMPLHIVTAGNIREDALSDGRSASIPFHMANKNGTAGMARRQCTSEYKLQPIRRFLRQMHGEKRPKPETFEMWIGISTDEIQRMKPSTVQYIKNRHPLIEAGMNRSDCHAWFERNYPGKTLAKSSCIGCPFKSNHQWRSLKQNAKEWADAVDFDVQLRAKGAYKAFDGVPYLHPSLKPLSEADLGDDKTIDMFNNECEGMCGI